MEPTKSILYATDYVPSYATDIRNTWAKHNLEWAERIKGYLPPLPVVAVVTHHKPKV